MAKGSQYSPKNKTNKKDLPPLGGDLEPATTHYADDIRQFCTHLKKTKQRFSFGAIESFFNTPESKGYAASTWNRKRCALKTSILKWLDEIEAYDLRPRVKWFFRHSVRYVKKSSKVDLDKIPNLGQIQQLLLALPPKYSLILAVLLQTGLRIQEALDLNLTKSKQCGDKVEFRVRGKGSKERPVSIGADDIASCKRLFGSTDWLFVNQDTAKPFNRKSVWRVFNQTSKRVLGVKFWPHQARHLFVTRMRELGYSMEQISTYCGHSSISVTIDQYSDRSIASDNLPSLPTLLGHPSTNKNIDRSAFSC